MHWERWPNPDTGQLYEVEKCDGGTLECLKGDETFLFTFDANDPATHDVFTEVQYVRVAMPGSPPIPARHIEGGWELWAGNKQVLSEKT